MQAPSISVILACYDSMISFKGRIHLKNNLVPAFFLVVVSLSVACLSFSIRNRSEAGEEAAGEQ